MTEFDSCPHQDNVLHGPYIPTSKDDTLHQLALHDNAVMYAHGEEKVISDASYDVLRDEIGKAMLAWADTRAEREAAEEYVSSVLANYPGEENQVPPGEYKILDGDDTPVTFDPTKIKLFDHEEYSNHDLLPGVYFRGYYDLENGSSMTLISFLYHKLDSEGQLETEERAVFSRGFGYGEHPGHAGQPPSWYIMGVQVGTVNPETRELTVSEPAGKDLSVKHFSIACITDGPLGEPILANPAV